MFAFPLLSSKVVQCRDWEQMVNFVSDESGEITAQLFNYATREQISIPVRSFDWQRAIKAIQEANLSESASLKKRLRAVVKRHFIPILQNEVVSFLYHPHINGPRIESWEFFSHRTHGKYGICQLFFKMIGENFFTNIFLIIVKTHLCQN